MLASRAAGSMAAELAAVGLAECMFTDIPCLRARFDWKSMGAATGQASRLAETFLARTRSAARSPDRTDPSMVAGNPVAVQSPARNRFLYAVTGPGRSAFCSGVASNVARRSRTICQGGN